MMTKQNSIFVLLIGKFTTHLKISCRKARMLQAILRQFNREKRQIIEINAASNKRVYQSSFNVNVNGSNNILRFWQEGEGFDQKSNGLETVNSVFKSSSDLFGAPSRFLNKIENNWTTSLVLISIILVSSLLLFCMCRYNNCCGKRNRATNSNKMKKLVTKIGSSSSSSR